MTNWNPDLYMKFGDERTQPAVDLAGRIDLDRPKKIIDLGCGPGNSTQVLRGRWPSAQVMGLDSSPDMIEKARATYPAETWVNADIAQWNTADRFDLVFSNATLQWVPDHRSLIPRLFARVAGGGVLAVQLPANDQSPLHLALIRTSQRSEWAKATAGCAELITYNPPEFYYDILAELSRRICIWQTIYHHVLPDHQGLIDWYSSTGMKTYLSRLADDRERRTFTRQVLEECRSAYPSQRDGKILFPFQRLFILAYQV